MNWREKMADKCTHDLAEKETACADGVCPICLRGAVAQLLEGAANLQGQLDSMLPLEQAFRDLQAENDQLRAEVKKLRGEGTALKYKKEQEQG
jgi:hypothetical protein